MERIDTVKRYMAVLVLLMAATLDLSSKDLVFGVVDNRRKIIIPFRYEYISPSETEGFYSAKKDGRWGVIDTAGRVVIPFLYAESLGFGKQYLTVTFDGENYGAIDYRGNEILPPRYEFINSDENGHLFAESDGLFHMFDLSGREILPPIYRMIDCFTEKLIPVELDGKWGLVEAGNNIVLPFEFDRIGGTYMPGGANFLIASKYYIEVVDSCETTKCEISVYNDRMEKVMDGIYDSNFSWVQLDSMLVVKKDGKEGMIKLDGLDTEVIPPIYKDISIWRNGSGIIEDFNGKYALILSDGTITPFIYDYATISDPPPGVFRVYRTDIIGGKDIALCGVIDRYGNVIDSLKQRLEVKMDGVSVFQGDRINDDVYMCYIYVPDEYGVYRYAVIDGGPYAGKNFGLMDARGKILIPPVYEGMNTEISHPSTGWAVGPVKTYLPENHVLMLKDSLWSVMDVSKNRYVLKDWDRIHGVYNNQYIVGKKK